MAGELGQSLSYWLVLPFVGMLLCVAVLPIAAPGWFVRRRNAGMVAAFFGLPVVVYLLVAEGHAGREAVLETAHDYVSFVVMLAALFICAGGIFLTGNVRGRPRDNLAFLSVGAVLCNFIGTTGASMVLIFPLLRSNSERRHVRHIPVFFIFIVCNIGGLLTPLGDPPLFIGFLQGVDFTWTLRLWPQWLLVNSLILAVFYVLDRRAYARETPAAIAEDVADYEPLGFEGRVNVLFLAGIVAAVAASSTLERLGEAIHFPLVREAIMIAMAALSLTVGPREPRVRNRFSWAPITEVGILFAGIFAAMIPTLALLRAHGSELGLTAPWHFFWATNGLATFLDNAPSYLTSVAVAQGYLGLPDTAALMSEQVGAAGHAPAAFLAAISLGAVFGGANSYIGDAPNFMVKSIAEEQGVDMPHFFGFMGYAAVVLVPIYVLVTLLFFL